MKRILDPLTMLAAAGLIFVVAFSFVSRRAHAEGPKAKGQERGISAQRPVISSEMPLTSTQPVSVLSPALLTLGETGASNHLKSQYGKLPLQFEANAGHTDGRVKYLSRGSGYNLFLTEGEAVLALKPRSAKLETEGGAMGWGSIPSGLPLGGRHDSCPPSHAPGGVYSLASSSVLRMRLEGSNQNVLVAGEEELPGKTNYFIGDDPAKWRTDVSNYQQVRYRDVYPGIDLVYHGDQRQLEYDLVVAPASDPGVIRLAFQGARRMNLDADGALKLDLPGGDVYQHRPVIYQNINGARKEIPGGYFLRGKSERNHGPDAHPTFYVGFRLGAYDHTQPLIIDPVLVYSTYLGGSGIDQGNGIAVDGSGNAYITGLTQSPNFPVANALEGAYGGGGSDAFVAKLNPAGTALVYSTYLGGSGADQGNGIAVDGSGNAYVTGSTDSTNFPLMNAEQSTHGGTVDAFVTKLNAAGNKLVYSTYLGGSGYDYGFGIAIDNSGNAYIGGYTVSNDFPVANALQGTYGGDGDAFVTKLNAAGNKLVYSTYLGGGDADDALGIAVDGSGNAYVTGATQSTNFPLANANQGTYGGTGDAFVTKLDAAGNKLIYSTYLGGSSSDVGAAIAADGSGNAYVTGYTSSTNFPLANALQGTYEGGQFDAFVTKLNPSGTRLIYSTYLGGSGYDQGQGIAVDGSGNAYITGYTGSSNFPLANALQGTYGGGQYDAFVTKLSVEGNALVYSTYLGGSGAEGGAAIAVNGSGTVYVTGLTNSTDFPVKNAFQGANGGNNDAFVATIASSTTCATQSFAGPTNYRAGTGPESVATGDFNGDGKLDLAVADFNSSSVSVLLGKGDGSFQAPVGYAAGTNPFSVTTGDFNDDGKLDVAVANYNSNSISVFLGNGDGTFQAATIYSAGALPVSIAAGDFNGDGRLDLAVANYNSTNVSVLLGNGDGTFQTAVNYAVTSGPLSIITGDFNGDGKLDLAVANYSNVSVLLGKGDGTFQPAVNYRAGSRPSSLTAGDFNGDGKLDLAVANRDSNDVSVLLGKGDGTFQAPISYPAGTNPKSVTTGDFNGDGKLDLAVANNGSNNVSVLLGNGDGTFQGAVDYPAGANPVSVITGDFNGDSRPDLVVANHNSNNVSVLLDTCGN